MTPLTNQAVKTSLELEPNNQNIQTIFKAEQVISQMPDLDYAELKIKIAKDPKSGIWRVYYGLALAHRGEHFQACQEYLLAIRLGFKHWRAAWYLAKSAKEIGDISLVDDACQVILSNNNDFWYAREFPKHARGYYSQNNQDSVIERFFLEYPAKNKIFIEVGAFDGVHYSNVRRLFEKYKWTGVCIEPVEKNFVRLSESYQNTSVRCIRTAVADIEGEMELNVSTYPHLPEWGSDVATFTTDGMERWEKSYGALWHKEKVTVKRLTSILDEQKIDTVDFLSVDTEGHDLRVLQSLDFSRFRPQLIVVEYGNNRPQILRYLATKGYSLILDNGQDLFMAEINHHIDPSLKLPKTINYTGDNDAPYAKIQKDVENRLQQFIHKEPTDVERIVIVGGYLGFEVNSFLKNYPRAEIHIFEPSQRYFQKLRQMYSHNPRVHCYKLAVGDQDEIATFYEGTLEGVGSLLPLKTQEDNQTWIPSNFYPAEQYEVQVVTLDRFLPLKNKMIDLLWCDVQGAELKVLQSAKETLTNCRALFLEVAATKTTYNGQCSLSELQVYLRSQGFYLAAVGLDEEGTGTGNALWLPIVNGASHKLRNQQKIGRNDWVTKLNPHLLSIGFLALDQAVTYETIAPTRLLTPERFDIMAKYLYARHRELNVNSQWARELYIQHIKAFTGGSFYEEDGSKHSPSDYLRNFDQLLALIKERGFDEDKTMVPIGQGDVIIDGTHRVAACLMYDYPVSCLKFERKTNKYDYLYFKTRGLDEKWCDAIAYQYCLLNSNTYLAIIFPSAQGKDEAIRATLEKYGSIFYQKSVYLFNHGARNLVTEIYAGESWLGDWSNNFAGAIGKVEPCFQHSGPLRVYVFETEDLALVRRAKDEIRQLFNLENHSIHINDTHQETIRLAQMLLNENSIHFLNYAQPKYFSNFFTHLAYYEKWIATENLNKEFFCIDGSATMAAYGIRDARDLDYLHYGYDEISSGNPDVSSHNSETHHHITTRDDIIFNPDNHFYYKGMKFISLALIRAMKAKRGEGKDITDVKSIDRLLNVTPSKSISTSTQLEAKSVQKSKIVGLLTARNEAQFITQTLYALARYTDAIVFLDDASDDNTVEIVKSLAKECHIERILEKKSWYRDEPGDRNAVLAAGREIGGTHFIILDADEMFTANCANNDALRRQILALQPGQRLQMSWVQLWRSVHHYRYDDSIWTNNYKHFAFCDDGQCFYKSDFIHTSRVPDNLAGQTLVISGYEFGVLHFQFVNWRNLLIKQAWYRCLEHIHHPNKSITEINTRYAPSKDETGLGLKLAPPEWFGGYEFFEPAIFDQPETWREAQVLNWFEQYGRTFFAELDIWDVDWNKTVKDTPQIIRSVGGSHPLVSAIVSTYNSERFIRGCLEDLEAQTIADRLEIIVIDSGSQQNERAIVEEFQQRYDNIVYIRTEERETIYAAWNRAVKAARGKYLTNANTDDRHRSDAFAVMIQALEQYPQVGLVYADCLITSIPNETFANNSAQTVLHWPDYSLKQALMYSIFGPQPMWRRKLHKEVGYFNPNYTVAGDYEFFLRIAWRFGAFRIPEILGSYFEGPGVENRNQIKAQQETVNLLKTYRAIIPIEDIYPYLKQSTTSEADKVYALLDLGNQFMQGLYPDFELAAHYYRRALALIPDNPGILNNLAIALALQNNQKESFELFKRAIELGSDVAPTNIKNYHSKRFTLIFAQNQMLAQMPPMMPPQNTRCTPNHPAIKQMQIPQGASLPPNHKPGISFCIISNGNRQQKLEQLVQNIQAQGIPEYEIIIVGIAEPLPGVKFISLPAAAQSGQTSVLRNTAAAQARFQTLVFSDDDIVLMHGWFSSLQPHLETQDILISKLLNLDGTRHWDWATIDGPKGHRLLNYTETDPHLYFTSGLLVVKAHVWQTIRWNETLGFYENEDVDFSQRAIRAGFSAKLCLDSIAVHDDPYYTQVGSIMLKRTDRGAEVWLKDQLNGFTNEQLVQCAIAEIELSHMAEAADCLRYCLQNNPGFSPAMQLWQRLIRQFGGSVEAGEWSPHPILSTPSEKGSLTAVPLAWAESIFTFSGYSYLSRQTLLDLDRRGIPVRMQALARDEKFIAQLTPTEIEVWNRLLDAQITPEIGICFHPPVLWNGTNFYNHYRQHNPGLNAFVGATMFETDRLPTGWAEACNGMDEVWVPTTFSYQTFARSGVDPAKLQIIPFGLDTHLFDPAVVTPIKIPGQRGFTFLSVFQWNKRKGWDILIKAYLQAFSVIDDVCLVIRAYPDQIKEPSIQQRIHAYVRQLGYNPAAIPPIIWLDQFVPEKEMPALYAAADAFVLPTRGEGWGIPFMEAMAMELPVIATRWSAHLDFMSDANSYLIDIEGLVPVDSDQTKENPFYTPDQQWAEPSLAETVRLMRHVFEHQAEARAKGVQARRHIQQNWTLKRTTDWISHRSQTLIEHKQNVAHLNIEPAQANQLSVMWHAPIFDPSGYADEARNFILQLRRRNLTIAARKAGRDSEKFRNQLDPASRHQLDEALNTQTEVPFISLIHFPAYAFQRLPEAAYNIGRVMFETDGLPSDWVDRCNRMDEIWVPTDFNLETFRSAGVTTKLTKIPGGVDTQQFRPDVEPLAITGARGTVFLSVFEWIYRKGWDVLLRAWATAFSKDDNVTLVLRTYPINTTDIPNAKQKIEYQIDHFLQTELGLQRDQIAPIIIIGKQVPEQDLPRLFTAATAYVSCSRGEGWGRPQMQAMACGLPVIATRWGGNLEFMTETNSLLLDVASLVNIDHRAEIPFYHGQQWAEPSVEHLVTLLHYIYNNPAQAATIGRQARQDMLEKWQWSTIADIAAKRLHAIQAEIQPQTITIPTKRPPSTKSIAVRWEGSQFVTHSLALINREVCLRLAETEQLDLSIIPYERHQFGAEVEPRFAQIEKYLNRPLSRPADVHVRHQWPPNFIPPTEGHWVIIQPWEFGSLPQKWVDGFAPQVDEMWVPSNYVRECYIRSGIPANRVFTIPNGVNIETFRPEAPPYPLKTQKRFKYLFVGGTIARKGIDILLDVYARTFTAADDVCLIIKDMGGQSFYQGQTAQELIAKIQAAPNAPEIEYIDRTLSEPDLAGLYTACDCLVHPYRGEGFGLPIAEAMACGLPPIVTGYGAALDFCNNNNAYLIPAQEVKFSKKQIGEWETVDYPWWAEPDKQALSNLLKHTLNNPQEAKAKGQVALVDIRNNFTWEHTALIIKERLTILQGQPILRLKNNQTKSQMLSGHTLRNGTTTTHNLGDTMAYDGILNQMITSAQTAGSWQQAISLVQEAVKYAPPGPIQAGLWNSLGYSYFQIGQLAEAEAAFQTGLHSEPQNMKLLKNLIDLYRQQAQLDKATEYINQGLRVDPDDIEILLSLGECAIQLGAFDVAEMAFVRVKALEPDTAGIDEILTELFGTSQSSNGSLNGTAPSDDVSIAREKTNQILAKGQAALNANDLAGAAQEFAWVVAQYPNLAAGHMALGSALLAMGRTEAAITPLRRVVELLPELAAGYNQLGVAYYRADHQPEAEAAFKQAHQLDSLDLEPCLNLIDLYRGQRNFEEAQAMVKVALNIKANHIEVQIAAGLVNAERGNFSEARHSLIKLEGAAPTHPGVAALRSLLNDQSNQMPDLISQVETAQAAGNWSQAITLLKAALTQPGRQTDPALWNSLGVSHFHVGQITEAETALAHGLKFDPNNLDLLSNLANLYLQQEQFDQATEYVNKALRIDPNHIEALIVLGHCCIRLNVFDTALTAFRRVAELAPGTEGVDLLVTELEAMIAVPV